jgi:hypothetical protein
VFLLADAIWYFENRFTCEQGRPYKHQDVERLNKYVTLDVHGPDVEYRSSAMINACGHIAEVMAWTFGKSKPRLYWRFKTKIDDHPDLGRMITRIWIEGCHDYGHRATQEWRAAYPPLLVYTRSKDLLPLLTFKESTPGALPPIVDLDPDPDPPICG